MRRISRWPIFTAVVLVLVLGGLTSVAIATVRKSFPETSGRLMVPGLKGQVEVLRDSYGVPHIYADNPEDLFLAQGYVHAQDRFFEMDFRRHLAAGRLSELFGPSQVETDAYVRTLGWRRVAEQELALLAPSTRRYLDAYAAGVNGYLEGRTAADLSLEYSLVRLQGLRYTPSRGRPSILSPGSRSWPGISGRTSLRRANAPSSPANSAPGVPQAFSRDIRWMTTSHPSSDAGTS